MSNYITTAALKDFKVDGIRAETVLEHYTDTDIAADITLAEEVIEGICGDIFYAKSATYSFDGTGNVKLYFFPEIPYRLISITSVKDYDIDGTTLLDTYIEGTDFKKYDYYLETARSYSGDSPRRRFGTGGLWPKGQKNIAIQGSWGRSAIPASITRATLLLALERLVPGFCELSPTDTKQAAWPDFTITFSGRELELGQSTGYIQIDQLLSRHINYVGMFLVVPDEKQTYDNVQVVE